MCVEHKVDGIVLSVSDRHHFLPIHLGRRLMVVSTHSEPRRPTARVLPPPD
jgi:hypothetical protein